jgi:hypothetical protein
VFSPLVEKAKARLSQIQREAQEIETFLRVARRLLEPEDEERPNGPMGVTSPAREKAEPSTPPTLSATDPTLSPSQSVRPARPESLKSLVTRLHRDNPTWTARQIAAHSGRKLSSVVTTLYVVRAEARAHPEHPETSDQAPSASRPDEEPPTRSRKMQTRPLPLSANRSRQGAVQYRLRDLATGLYLHCDLDAMRGGALRMVSKDNHPWQGTAQQMKNARERLPGAEHLIAQEVVEELRSTVID